MDYGCLTDNLGAVAQLNISGECENCVKGAPRPLIEAVRNFTRRGDKIRKNIFSIWGFHFANLLPKAVIKPFTAGGEKFL